VRILPRPRLDARAVETVAEPRLDTPAHGHAPIEAVHPSRELAERFEAERGNVRASVTRTRPVAVVKVVSSTFVAGT
jgi:hypothetical protein